MYHWIKDKKFLGKIKKSCSCIVNQVVLKINSEGIMLVRSFLVGSGAKNLFIQNGNNPIDLNYNIEIIKFNNRKFWNGYEIKEYLREKLNVVLRKEGLVDCKDSTSVLTTGKIHFKKGNQTEFSIDIGIVKQNDYEWHRLIHHKHGLICNNFYSWEITTDSREPDDRVKWLKKNNLWKEVWDNYLERKKKYLTRFYYSSMPSFIIYIESVNKIYYKNY